MSTPWAAYRSEVSPYLRILHRQQDVVVVVVVVAAAAAAAAAVVAVVGLVEMSII